VSVLRIDLNPFLDGTTIVCCLGPGGPDVATAAVCDVAGRVVRRLEVWEPGTRGSVWRDGADAAGNVLPGGIYPLCLPAAERSATARVIKIR